MSGNHWQGLATATGQGSNDLTGLQQLETLGAFPLAETGVMGDMMSCSWLLASAPNLSLLSAVLGTSPGPPRLLQLKHLTLNFHRGTANVSAAIMNSALLEILSLRALGHGPHLDPPVLQSGMLPLYMQ